MKPDDHEALTDADVERWLAEAPLRMFDARREAELVHAIHAATPDPPWWARRVPLWQAAAACAALVLVAIGVTRVLPGRSGPIRANESGSAAPPVRVTLDAPLFARATKPVRMNITRWRPMSGLRQENDHD